MLIIKQIHYKSITLYKILSYSEEPRAVLVEFMELFFFLSAFLLFFLLLAKIVKKSQPVKRPPGPMPLPIIGNVHQLLGPLPHRILADLAKKYGPLMHIQLGEVSTVVVSSAEVAKEVMSDHDIIFANRPPLLAACVILYNCQDIAFSPYGNYWRQMRKICALELLSSKRVQTFGSTRKEEVMNTIKSISYQKGSVVNLSKMIYTLSYSIIAKAAFGKSCKYTEEYMSIIEVLTKVFGGFSLVDLYPSVKIIERITGTRNKIERVREQNDVILEGILTEHKNRRAESKPVNQEAKEDLVDVLLNVQESREFGAPLTNNSIKAVIHDIFSAGGETSATTVIWAMFEMIKNPTMLERAQDEVRKVFGGKGNVNESQLHELKYLQAVIKESLRLHPAVPLLLPRESSEQCEINGYVIPSKTRVMVNCWAIGRDPMHWTDPERFNPDRFLDSEIDFKGKTFSYIPFGAGRRICPGMSFAMANMELQLAQLLYHFDWKLPQNLTPEDLDMTEIFGLTVGPKHDLKLIPTTHCLSIMESPQ